MDDDVAAQAALVVEVERLNGLAGREAGGADAQVATSGAQRCACEAPWPDARSSIVALWNGGPTTSTGASR